jgi:hypothetical protein
MKIEDAERVIIESFREPDAFANRFGSNHGYQFYIPNIIRWHLVQLGKDPRDDRGKEYKQVSTVFYNAAWELCRRGILRPSLYEIGLGKTTDASIHGNGYSLTSFGEQWLEEEGKIPFMPVVPGRLSELLTPFKDRFGMGYYSRSQEGIRCYKAHVYLACCTMCGAAAESILLATAIAKSGDEEKILKMYLSSQGRSRVESFILGQATTHIKRVFDGYLPLLKYWRDESAHGKVSSISESEAYISLNSLLRFAMFVNDNWDELT